jgi:hypothetical protein
MTEALPSFVEPGIYMVGQKNKTNPLLGVSGNLLLEKESLLGEAYLDPPWTHSPERTW